MVIFYHINQNRSTLYVSFHNSMISWHIDFCVLYHCQQTLFNHFFYSLRNKGIPYTQLIFSQYTADNKCLTELCIHMFYFFYNKAVINIFRQTVYHPVQYSTDRGIVCFQPAAVSIMHNVLKDGIIFSVLK